MRGLLAAALVETVLITWRDLSQEKIPPPPSDYVAVAIIYGGLALFPTSASTFTSLFGWGMVVATFLELWDPANPTHLATFTAPAPTTVSGAPLPPTRVSSL